MENRNLIIILLALIIVLAVALGFALFNPTTAKEPTELEITSDKALKEGDKLSIKLTDLNGTPIDNQTINISIIDKDGSVNHKSVVTNENGKATLKLNKGPGKYSVNCTFEGNDNYTNSSAFKKIKIEEKVEETSSSQSESYDSESYSSQSSYEDYRPEVDSTGITREEADKYGWTYTTDHGGHYRGVGDHWDEKAGIYHD